MRNAFRVRKAFLHIQNKRHPPFLGLTPLNRGGILNMILLKMCRFRRFQLKLQFVGDKRDEFGSQEIAFFIRSGKTQKMPCVKQ